MHPINIWNCMISASTALKMAFSKAKKKSGLHLSPFAYFISFYFILFGMHVCIQHWNMIWKHIHFLSVGVLNYKSLSLTKQKYARHLSPFLSSFPFWHRVCRPFFVCSLCKYIFDKFVERCRVMAIHKCCRNKTRNKPNVPKKSGKSSHGKKNQQTCQTACVCDSFSYFSLEIESQINQIK